MPNTANKPTLFLHIGHFKAASSSIQMMCRENADLLRREGVLVSGQDLSLPEAGDPGLHPLWYARDLLEQYSFPEAQKKLQQDFKKVANLILERECKGVVVSSENLSELSDENLESIYAKLFGALTKSFFVHVIYVVRRQDLWLESAWKEFGVKNGLTLKAFCKQKYRQGRPGYLAVANQWEEIADKITVLPIRSGTDVLKEFWSILGVSEEPTLSGVRENQTLDWSILEMMRQNPQLFAHQADNKPFLYFTRPGSDLQVSEPRRVMPRAFSRKILKLYAHENRLLQEKYTPELPLLGSDLASETPVVSPREMRGLNGVGQYLGNAFKVAMVEQRERIEIRNQLTYSLHRIKNLEEKLEELEERLGRTRPD